MDSSPAPPTGESESLLNLEDLLALVRFVKGSLLRHKLLVVACFLTTILLAVSALQLMSRTYEVTTRIMTQATVIIPSLTHPGRPIQPSAQSPTAGVIEMVKSRDNLAGIIEDTNLLEVWKQTRSKVGRFSDSLVRGVLGEPSPEEYYEAVLAVLDRKLWVEVEGSVVVIRFTWHDADTALAVVEVVSNRFLRERRSRELGEFQETVRLLEGNFADSQERIKAVAARFESSSLSPPAVILPPVPTATRPSSAPRESGSVANNLPALEQELASARQETNRIRSAHEERIARSREEISQLASSYGPHHPEMVKAARFLELLVAQDPVPQSLLNREAALVDALTQAKNMARAVEPRSERQRSTTAAPETVVTARTTIEDLDPLLSQEYRAAETEVNTLGELLTNARMELEAAQAAFEYRFKVTQPPLFPRRPIKPKPAQIIWGAVFLGVFLAVLFAVLADIRSGVILEAWQIRRGLGVALLGELDQP